MKILVELNRRLNFLCSDDRDIPVMHQDLFDILCFIQRIAHPLYGASS